MQPHPLDNPIWHALAGPHAGLGIVTGGMRRYLAEFAPFAAAEEITRPGLADMAETLPPGASVVLFTAGPVAPPAGLEVVLARPLDQMVADDLRPFRSESRFVPLGAADVPAMLGLVDLTRPGPFAARTVEMGRYLGVRDEGRLVAMAGERLRPPGFTEISAVCTHPDFRGRGHAKALISVLAEAILARGDTPFLHVLPENRPAIATYEALGFRTRCTLQLTVLERPATA